MRGERRLGPWSVGEERAKANAPVGKAWPPAIGPATVPAIGRPDNASGNTKATTRMHARLDERRLAVALSPLSHNDSASAAW